MSRRGASHDLAAARAISAAASVNPLTPPRPAWASNIFATYLKDAKDIRDERIEMKCSSNNFIERFLSKEFH